MQRSRPYYHFLVYNECGGDNIDYRVEYHDSKLDRSQLVIVSLDNNIVLGDENELEVFMPTISKHAGHSDVKLLSYKEL